MGNWWISWYHEEHFTAFELCSPWWLTGRRCSDGSQTVCAAIKAESENEAKRLIYKVYDIKPSEIEFRFVNARPTSWNPFTERFERQDWMVWDGEVS